MERAVQVDGVISWQALLEGGCSVHDTGYVHTTLDCRRHRVERCHFLIHAHASERSDNTCRLCILHRYQAIPAADRAHLHGGYSRHHLDRRSRVDLSVSGRDRPDFRCRQRSMGAPIANDVNLDIKDGEFVVLVGLRQVDAVANSLRVEKRHLRDLVYRWQAGQ